MNLFLTLIHAHVVAVFITILLLKLSASVIEREAVILMHALIVSPAAVWRKDLNRKAMSVVPD